MTSKIDTNLIILEYKFTIITPYGLQISFSLKLNNFYFEYNKIERTKFYSCWKQNWHMLFFSLIRKKQRKFEKVLTWKLGILEKWNASKSYTLIVLFCLTDWYGYVWWGEKSSLSFTWNTITFSIRVSLKFLHFSWNFKFKTNKNKKKHLRIKEATWIHTVLVFFSLLNKSLYFRKFNSSRKEISKWLVIFVLLQSSAKLMFVFYLVYFFLLALKQNKTAGVR